MLKSKKAAIWLVALLAVAIVATGCKPPPPPPPTVLKVAIIGNPPTLDIVRTTASVTLYTMWHVFEPLFTMDANYNPIPHLVKNDWKVSEDGLTYTFNLREGVKFHNGKEMTSDDVVASLERFGEHTTWGKNLWSVKDSLTASGKYGIVLKLKEPVAIVPLYLTTSNLAIMPKEIIAEAGTGHVSKFIGTGPFEFVEYLQDRHIKLKKFKDYSALPGQPNGYGGKREALVDELLFIPIEDAAVRIAGVQTGDYHFGEWIPPDEYERLKAISSLVTRIIKPSGWTTACFNRGPGSMMENKKLRQAILAAFDMEPIMKAAYGHPDFWRLDSGVLFKEQGMYSDAGKEFYNQANPERAKQLAKEAGYKGQTIRWLTTQTYPAYYTTALVGKQQLEAAGFNVELIVVDWATLVTMRSDPKAYELFSTAFGTTWDPVLGLFLSPSWPAAAVAGQDPEMIRLLNAMRRESDPAVRMQLWDQAQAIFWDDVPVIKFGDYFNLHIHRPEVQGYQGMQTSFFWNVSLVKK